MKNDNIELTIHVSEFEDLLPDDIAKMQFAKIPYKVVYNKEYEGLSDMTKSLYEVLLGRALSLFSQKNRFLDEKHNLYIIFPLEEIMQLLSCEKNKAIELLSELETLGLIIMKEHTASTRETRIYIKKYLQQFLI
ncbi:hypothetical protein M2140_000396 [Clostridiales Family XIII bacterium PM5-7]